MSALMIAGTVGLAFGWVLESAGLGEPRKLAGQFYLRDFTVLKVMSSAMLTAMLAIFWNGRFGLVDPVGFFVPDTYLLPQLVGGLVFGVGFALCGLCPGTSCVAFASGRAAGPATMLGMFAGVLLFGLAFPAIESFYRATPHGAWTLTTLSGLPQGVVIALLTTAILAMLAWVARREAIP